MLRPIAVFGTVALALGTIVACVDHKGEEWFHLPPAPLEWTELPLADVHEVANSKFPLAIRRLAATSFSPLSKEETTVFTGYESGAAVQKQAFLVRAVFGRQDTGAYTVLRHGRDLLIRHLSFNDHPSCSKGALVLSLDFTPGEVYVANSSAR